MGESGMCCVILSGGAASRAGGQNKSFIKIQGKTVLEHQLIRLEAIIERQNILLVTDRSADYAASGLRCAGDVSLGPSGRSAMRGLYSALELASRAWVLVLANDMPWPNVSIIRRMQESILEQHALGACIEHNGRIEPMHAIYHRELSEDLAMRLAAENVTPTPEGLSLQTWLASHRHIIKFKPENKGFGAADLEELLTNLNTGAGDA